LAAAIAVLDQPATMGRSAIVDGLLGGIQDEARKLLAQRLRERFPPSE
jgi:hypothetical protein